MFLTFNTNDERFEYGGSSFIEIQFCKMPLNSKIESIVSVDNIKHWRPDSIYIRADDDRDFYKQYRNIFNSGFYNNMEKGIMYLYGINYYTAESIDDIILKINETKPDDYTILLKWLEEAKKYNGFYILGL